MEDLLKLFEEKMKDEGKAENTIKSYMLNMREYFSWFIESYGNLEFKGLYRGNINEYKNYLKNLKRVGNDRHNLDVKSINAKLAALVKYNELMQPDNIVISKKDYYKVQKEIINPTDITKRDVEQLRQNLLQAEGYASLRNYTIVTIMAYGGLRISEVLNLKRNDVSTAAGQIRVSDGKGGKQRTVIANSKIVSAINEYMKEYNYADTEYLFYNNKGKPLNRSTINKVFNNQCINGKNISPHDLRHFFCYNALESGAYSINEVAQQAGHADIRTTMIYTNPNLQRMREKAELL